MMTFNLNLTPKVLSELTAKLSRLATDVTYRPGTPGVLTIDSSEANEPAIVELVAGVTKTDDVPLAEDLDPIDYAELAREAQRAKRLAATQEHEAMQRIRAKRARQSGVAIGL